MEVFHSHGKLLISGEYVILNGATGFALPTKFGQSLEVTKIEKPVIKWKSYDEKQEIWFEDNFEISALTSSEALGKHEKNEVSKMLFLTLFFARKMAPEKFSEGGFEINTKSDFPRNWGLGTSSTLVANLAKWLKIDPYELLKHTFGGSGYDVAVAMHETAITFEKHPFEKHPFENSILKTSFDPAFKDQIFFVHLNQKQNSREAIQHYRQQDKTALNTGIDKISALTHSLISSKDLLEFKMLLEVHENIISQLVGLQKVKSRLFPDYPGAIKSLGGWGGDFVLVTGTAEDMEYFRRKGYNTILSYSDMIL